MYVYGIDILKCISPARNVDHKFKKVPFLIIERL